MERELVNYLSVSKNRFICDDTPVQLRGAGLGGWLNLEHFLFGVPGTESQIRQAFTEAFGQSDSDTFWQKFYRVFAAESDFRYMKASGLNHVRLPVHYQHFLPDFEHSTAIVQLDRVIQICKKLGLWAIIDLHAVAGGQNPDWHSDNASGRDDFWQNEKAQTAMVELWAKLADYYSHESVVAGYDLINEPCYFEPGAEQAMLRFFERCTEAIRRVDARHIIIYTGNTYGRDFSMFERNLDENAAYTFHYYPFLQIPDQLNDRQLSHVLHESMYKDVSLKHLQETLQKPLWCGETGFQLHSPPSAHALKQFIALLENQHIGWSLWSLKDAGSMGLLHTRKNAAWNTLCRRTSQNWIFWKLFTQDSMLAAKEETDPYDYYRWLANETTVGWQVFREAVKETTLQDWLTALDDFAFCRCERGIRLQDLMP
jgi:hypothetical protein